LAASCGGSLEERLPLTGTADHFVSQGPLLSTIRRETEIEVYADRPAERVAVPQTAALNIGTDHLDFERLLRIAEQPQPKFSSATVLGHMHLNVSDLDHLAGLLRIDGHGSHGGGGDT